MFTKHDERFAELAAEPRRRAAAIRNLSRVRTIMFWCACLSTLGAVVSNWRGSAVSGISAFTALVPWMLVFKYESDLRLLQVIGRLQQDRGN